MEKNDSTIETTFTEVHLSGNLSYKRPESQQGLSLEENDNPKAKFNVQNLLLLENSINNIIEKIHIEGTFSIDNFVNYFIMADYTQIWKSLSLLFNDSNIINNTIYPLFNLQLLTMDLGLIILKTNNKKETLVNQIKNIIIQNYHNYLYLAELIIRTIKKDNLVNAWFNKLQRIILTNIAQRIPKNIQLIITAIEKKNKYISEQIKIILISNKAVFSHYDKVLTAIKIYNKQKINWFINLTQNILNKYTKISLFSDLDTQDEVYQNTEQSDILCSVHLPFLHPLTIEANFLLTLVLDLDETLINFKMIDQSEKGTLRMRPGLIEFLEDIKKLNIELVVFTAATQDYADPIIDAIESEMRFFDYRLYRQHSAIIGSDYIKDLSNLGRDLKKVIIVDNSAENFSLQKDNGILIYPFYGNNEDDDLLDNLYQIIYKMVSEEFEDIRNSLVKFKDEIMDKITNPKGN